MRAARVIISQSLGTKGFVEKVGEVWAGLSGALVHEMRGKWWLILYPSYN